VGEARHEGFSFFYEQIRGGGIEGRVVKAIERAANKVCREKEGKGVLHDADGERAGAEEGEEIRNNKRTKPGHAVDHEGGEERAEEHPEGAEGF